MLDEANNLHPNIKLVRQISQSVSFLDLHIENKNGTLVTSVFHKQSAEPYVVPFKSDHPRSIFKNVIDTALTRTIRYSSTLTAFNNERRSIKLTLLYNGFVRYIHFFSLLFYFFSPSYPTRYIHRQFTKFFSFHFQPSHILPTIIDENTIGRLHYVFVQTPTIPEYQRAARVARTIQQNPTEEVDDSLVRFQLNKQMTRDTRLLMHYTFEERLQDTN
jgi:hypothetical protein